VLTLFSPFSSPNDVAEVAVRILLSPREHYNTEYTLTGTAPIKEQEVASFLSKRLEKPVMYVDQPLHTFVDEMKQHQIGPEWMIDDLAALEKVKASGLEEDPDFVTDDIQNICGHKPQSFEEYLQEVEAMTTIELGHGLVVTAE